MYRAGKYNTADTFSRQPNYASGIEEDSCLLTLQSKLKAMKTVTSESLEPSKGKLNEADCIRCVSSMSASVRHKLIIWEKFKMDWHKLPESSIKKLNEADHTEHVGNIITLMGCKLTIWNVMHHLKERCTLNGNVGPLTPLFRRVIVTVIMMKKTHEKSASALMNLI